MTDLQPDASPPEEPIAEPVPDEPFLSGAYRRILHTAIALSIAATLAAALINWRSAAGLAAGSLIGCLNFVWLHQGAEMLVRRMLPGPEIPSKFWLLLSFSARYSVVLAAAYVILKSHPGMRVGFIVGLVLPVVAMMCEAAYEAFSNSSHSPKI
jgi:hypothetical protein